MSRAPMRPKIAPDAPTVTANAELNQSAPAEPASPETTYTRMNRGVPSASSMIRAEPEEREHVEREMDQAAVQEHRRHEPPPLTGRDDGALQRPVREELSPREVQPASLRRGDHVDDDVDRDQHHRRRSGHRAGSALHRLHRARGRLLDRAEVRVVGAADPDRCERHAVLADRPRALRARDERLAAGWR